MGYAEKKTFLPYRGFLQIFEPSDPLLSPVKFTSLLFPSLIPPATESRPLPDKGILTEFLFFWKRFFQKLRIGRRRSPRERLAQRVRRDEADAAVADLDMARGLQLV